MTEVERLRAERARILLGDDTFTLALAELRQSAIARWEISAPGAETIRDQAWAEVRALNSIQGQLQTWADDLKIFAAKA